jgi:hypothetical protein
MELGRAIGIIGVDDFCLCLHAMPHTQEPDPTSRNRGTPVCPACGKTMRLAVAVPSPVFINLDECRYRCECGEEADYIIARPD